MPIKRLCSKIKCAQVSQDLSKQMVDWPSVGYTAKGAINPDNLYIYKWTIDGM